MTTLAKPPAAPAFKALPDENVPGKEGADWGTDPGSGAKVVRLTSAPAMSHNIYCEQPYASPDGKRVLLGRMRDTFGDVQLLVADVEAMSLTRVEASVPSELVAHVPWGEWAYYPMADGSIRRLSLVTLERQEVLPRGTVAKAGTYFSSITPDERYLVCDEPVGTRPGSRTLLLDTRTGERRTIYDGPDNLNSHAQVDRSDRQRMLFQLLQRGNGVTRVTVHARELAGGELGEARQLPVGSEWTADSSGHMAWIGTTGKAAIAVNWDRANRKQDPRHPEGNVVVAAPGNPGEAKPTVFPMPGHALYHVSVSRCGRYFVGDDFMHWEADAFAHRDSGTLRGAGPIRIVVGCFATGRSAVLVRDCQNYGIAGSSRFEPDPYFTADNRNVIYNASPFGTMQVFAARVPEGFLEALG